MKRIYIVLFCTIICILAAGCSRDSVGKAGDKNEECEITIFAAKSLNCVLEEIIDSFENENPGVKLVANYDGSGALQTQIEEGAECDVFFSADQDQMNILEQKALLIEGSRRNIVNNQLCVVTYKGSNTPVTGLKDMDMASSLAIAGGSVPAGKYTRQALINIGKLSGDKVAAEVTTQEISQVFKGVTINECVNVGAVAVAVAEASNEVGTVYYSDTFGYEDKLEILEAVSNSITGEIVYPAAVVVNKSAGAEKVKFAKKFVDYLAGEKAKNIFERYHFDTNVN